KVSKQDKDKKRLLKEFREENNQRDELDEYHKIIYSTDKALEHLNKFNREYKFVYSITHDSKGHEKQKEDRVYNYEKLQKKMDSGKKARDEIFRQLEEEGLLNEKDYEEADKIFAIEPTEVKILNDNLKKMKSKLTKEVVNSALKNTKSGKYADLFD